MKGVEFMKKVMWFLGGFALGWLIDIMFSNKEESE